MNRNNYNVLALRHVASYTDAGIEIVLTEVSGDDGSRIPIGRHESK